jgi:hypothetical protein
VKTPRNVAPGTHAVGMRVRAAGGVVNEASTNVILKK